MADNPSDIASGDAALGAWLASRGPACVPERIIPDGAAVGPFRVLGLLGRGGNAEVCRARHDADGAIVALKVPLRSDDAAAERFRREANLLAMVESPALPRLVASGDADGRPWIALEELKPGDLPSEPGAVETFLLRLCEGVARLHALGFVHRDIKPGNILFRADGTPVLIDLGFAKEAADRDDPAGALPPGEPLSLDGSRAVGLGTPGWAAPEQFSGGDLSPAADVYSLGLLALRCFGGRPPPSWRHVLRRATSPLPAARFPSAAAFARAVRRRRRPFVAAAVAGVVLVVAAGLSAAALVARGRARAAEGERRAGETLEIVKTMLSAARPGEDAGRSDATVLAAVERALPAVRAERDPGLRANLAMEFGKVLDSVGRYSEAEELFDIAVSARRRAGDSGDALAAALVRRGIERRRTRRENEAVSDIGEALAIRKTVVARDPSRDNREALATTLGSLGAALSFAGRGEEAAAAFAEGIGVWRTLVAEEPGKYEVRLARGLHNLGVQLHELERYGEAVAAHEEAMPALRARAAAGEPGADEEEAFALAYLADSLRGAGRLEEAADAFGESIPRLRAMAQNEPGTYAATFARALGNYAILLHDRGDGDAAVARLDEALAILRKRNEAEPGSCDQAIAAFLHDREVFLSRATEKTGSSAAE